MLSPYKLHDVLNIPHDVSMHKVGEFDYSDLIEFRSRFERFQFTMEVSFQMQFVNNVNIRPKNNILFGFKKSKFFDELLVRYIPALLPFKKRQIHSIVHYAHVHEDSRNAHVVGRGQLMFIIENNVNHMLYSKNSSGVTTTRIPKAGEIIFLDTFCDHALFPNNLLDVETVEDNPLKFSGASLPINI